MVKNLATIWQKKNNFHPVSALKSTFFRNKTYFFLFIIFDLTLLYCNIDLVIVGISLLGTNDVGRYRFILINLNKIIIFSLFSCLYYTWCRMVITFPLSNVDVYLDAACYTFKCSQSYFILAQNREQNREYNRELQNREQNREYNNREQKIKFYTNYQYNSISDWTKAG